MPGILRRAAERQATPVWLKAHTIREIFKTAENLTRKTSVQHSVDHIVPLRHPLVCGLHCPANMRVIPLAENLRKSNNYWPGMWGEQGALF